MVLPHSFPEVKSLHAYAAVVLLGIAFSLAGVITEIQLAIVTLVFGFIALIDTLGDLLASIERVIEQMDAVNNGDSADRDQERNQTGDRNQ